MRAMSPRDLKALTILSIIVPVSLLASFRLTGVLGEPESDGFDVDASGSEARGVEVEDWAKYDVICEGTPHLWNAPLVDAFPIEVESIRVEVLDVSTPNVTIREIIHLFDGEERKRTVAFSPADAMIVCGHYVIPQNVSEGYTFPFNRPTYDPVSRSWKTVDWLQINATAWRSYGGVSREVNLLEFSGLYPDFEYVDNITAVYVWDRLTGFLLEKSWHSVIVGYENVSLSTVSVIMIDTNMWEMKAETQPIWIQRLPELLGAAVVFSVMTVAGILYIRRNRRT